MTQQKAECDVLVIGSGAAGMAAALSAADSGAHVIVAERATHLGGTSAISGGWMWLPGNPKGAAASGDTREEAEQYLRALAGDALDDRRVDEFLNAVPEAIDFFERRTDVSFVYPELSPDYSMLLPGAKPGGRAIHAEPVNARILGKDRLRIRPYKSELTVFGLMPQIGPDLDRFLNANREISSFIYVGLRLLRNWTERLLFRRALDLSNGNALIARMIATARKRGVKLWTSTEAVELTTVDGRIAGARLRRDGAAISVTARSGVILASGGFSHDRNLREKHYGAGFAADAHPSPMTPEHDGASARLAAPFGGHIEDDGEHAAAWCGVTVFGPPAAARTFPHLRGYGLPGLIAIDQDGRRFTNEAESYHSFGPAMVKASASHPETFAYFVADRRTMNKYGIGFAKPWPVPRLPYLRNGFLTRGRTLEELARKLSVDPATLRDAVDRFNEGARAGVDTEFGRGDGEFNRFKGDPKHGPNPTLGAVEKGPFFAAKVRLGDLGTFAGLATGRDGRVLDENDEPVPGLFAVGTAAVSVFAGTYPGAGAHLGPAVAFGYLAGRAVHASTDTASDTARNEPNAPRS